MSYHQTTITLPTHARGIHIITPIIEESIAQLIPHSNKAGLVHLFLQHTSASLAINENSDPDVRLDTEDWLNKIAPADQLEYRHTLEGSDDLPAHLKSIMIGVSLTIPLIDGVLGLGMWQGVYLCEHRDMKGYGGQRKLVITVNT